MWIHAVIMKLSALQRETFKTLLCCSGATFCELSANGRYEGPAPTGDFLSYLRDAITKLYGTYKGGLLSVPTDDASRQL